MRYLLVMAGGAAGSLLRYVISQSVAAWSATRFPLATFAVNLTGSFLIGLVLGAVGDKQALNLRGLLVAGFLGGFTTFSAFEWEVYRLGRSWMALAYAAASVVLGLTCCWCGAALTRR
jgi:CrcB protein